MKIRYGEITKNVLFTLAIVGVLTVAAASPNAFASIAKKILNYKKYREKYTGNNTRKLARSLNGLNKNKIIIIKKVNGEFKIKLTENGKKIVAKIHFADMKIEKQKIWDKKWRIVTFDIPEEKAKYARDALRQKLQKVGFYQLQKSVWVHPYPCEKEILLICELLGVNPFVNIVTAEKIYNDDCLKEYFKLS